MKKILSTLLALIMVFSLTVVPVSAQDVVPEQPAGSGQITIVNPSAGTHYKIYKILDVNAGEADSSGNFGSLVYVVNTEWADFFNGATAQEYVNIDASTGHVTAKEGFTDSTASTFAVAAITYAKEHTDEISAVAEVTADGGENIVFKGLAYGYYLVDTSIGALCGLTTTQPTASISIKNIAPTITKSVEENGDAGTGTNAWRPTNSAAIGDIVNFDVTINAQNGAQNYVFHDKMDAGLELLAKETGGYEVQVKYHAAGENSVATTWTEGTHYELKVGADTTCADPNCDFEIVFKREHLQGLKTQDKIYVLYSAKMTEGAVANEAEEDKGIKNTAWLTFGDGHKTDDAITKTNTYGFEIIKTDPQGKMLNGAKFKLYATADDAANDNAIALVKMGTNSYRKATSADANTTTEIEVVCVEEEGKKPEAIARVYGFDTDIYYIKEIAHPQGYNPMVGLKDFTISDTTGDLYAKYDTNGTYEAATGVHVINSVGSVLPTTGGTGTVMFISIGTIMAMMAGVLLVTKKRMSMIED